MSESKDPKDKSSGKLPVWYTYILECRDGSLYTGVSTNVERRFKEHCAKKARYTSYNPPVQIVYTERFRNKIRAFKREAQIKGWTRRKKLALIEGDPALLKML